MKTKLFVVLAIAAVVSSCKKADILVVNHEPGVFTGISYPAYVYYGDNILSMPDSTNLVNNLYWYGLGAELENGANLKLKLTNLSTIDTTMQYPMWFYEMSPTGWAVGSYNSDQTQIFVSSQTGKIDAKFVLDKYSFPGGAFKIDFYENSDTVTQTKYFTWN